MKNCLVTTAMFFASIGAIAQTATFSAANIIGEQGSTVILEVVMNDDFDANDFQCFVDLPDGVVPRMNVGGRPDVSWGGRQGDHGLSANMIDNQCRIIGYSASGAIIGGDSGTLFSLPLVLGAPVGSYEINLTNCHVSMSNGGVDVTVPDTKLTLKIETYPQSITLNASSADVTVNRSYQLTASVTPADASNKSVAWYSSDPTIATVKNGLVVGKKIGDAVITAKTTNNKTAACLVHIRLRGDVNCDNQVDIGDCQEVINIMLD